MTAPQVAKAHVASAIIQVNQVIVGNRKMALNTFRQIIEENIIDFKNVEMRGVAWGHVTYSWPKIEYRLKENTLHILWQKGDELRRCFINGHFDDPFFTKVRQEDYISLFFSSDNMDLPTPNMKIKLQSKEMKKLIDDYGINPPFQVFPLDDFQQRMKDYVVEWKKSAKEDWARWITIKGERNTFSNHFWGAIKKQYPHLDHAKDISNQIAKKHIKSAYEIFVNNYLNPCNQMVDSIKNGSKHLFV